MTAKIEIGGPMASLYLLKHPDHYTSHTFKTFYWKSYVREVQSVWKSTESPADSEDLISEDLISTEPEKIMIDKQDDEYIAISATDDYVYRPDKHENVSLYDWIRLATKYKCDRIVDSDLDEVNNFIIDNKISDNKEISDDLPNGLRRSHRKKTMAQTMKDHIEYENHVDDAYLHGDSWADSTDEYDNIEDDDDDDYFFMEGHRQQNTHAVWLEEDNSNIVPNFVGGSLP